MNADQLRELQAPLKQKYKDDPESARQSLKAVASLKTGGVTCAVDTFSGSVTAGLHPATGGDGSLACSGDMLLEALVGCAGVTLRAVSTALQIPVNDGTITAQGDLDFRGTLGVSKETPVGLTNIRVHFALDTEASDEQIGKLLKLTERYCVVYQTLASATDVSTSWQS